MLQVTLYNLNMRFTEWLHIRESEQIVTKPTVETPQLQLPDASQVVYTAAVLDRPSQDTLVSLIHRLMMETTGSIPQGWTGRAHHMTIKFRPTNDDIRALAGKLGNKDGVELKVTDWAVDEYGVAVVVTTAGLPVTNGVPHVTIAHSKDVGAVYSNTLLADRSKWKPLYEGAAMLKAYVVGVGPRDVIVPDMAPIPLARPVFSFR